MAPQDSLVAVGAEQSSATTEWVTVETVVRDRVSETVCP